jgi:hypothetical protein
MEVGRKEKREVVRIMDYEITFLLHLHERASLG